MGFVVEEVPLGSKIVGGGASPIVGIGKGFGAGAKEGKLFPQFKATLPNYFANVFGGGN